MKEEHPIDIVIAWVDGGDPVLAAKRNKFLGREQASSAASGAHATRFASVDEIRYCVLSIFRFAPFVRNIFVLTDGQDPELYEDIKKYFPERLDSFKVVDHTEVFEGFEDCLPSFNSISIGHMTWRIKGLSEHYVYFNDDIFLVREMKPEDWFREGRPVIRGKWVPAPYLRLAWEALRKGVKRGLLRKKDFKPRSSFHLGQWNSASLLGYRWRYFAASHTPHTVWIPEIREFAEKNREVLHRNLCFHFRDPSQFTFIALSNHLLLRKGLPFVSEPGLSYMQPFGREEGYIEKKISYCEQHQEVKYLCVQSLDRCSAEEQSKVLDWLNRLLSEA